MARASAPEISVVVPSHRAGTLLHACIEALRRQTLAADRFEVLVVDTGEDGAEPVVAGAGFRYIHDSRRGPAAKRNAGAAAARGAYLAFLDSDCRPEPGWLEAGLAELLAGADVVQGAVLPPPGEPTSPFGHHVVIDRPSPRYESANIFYAQGLFRELGGFPEHLHERFGEHFGEDALLGVMAGRAGARVSFSPGAAVRHAVFAPDPGRHLRERWRLRHYPYLVGLAPELRKAMTGGLFLRPGHITVWLALLGLATRRRGLTLPYLVWLLWRLPRSEPRRALRNAPFQVASDLTGAVALAWGSLRHRQPVL